MGIFGHSGFDELVKITGVRYSDIND